MAELADLDEPDRLFASPALEESLAEGAPRIFACRVHRDRFAEELLAVGFLLERRVHHLRAAPRARVRVVGRDAREPLERRLAERRRPAQFEHDARVRSERVRVVGSLLEDALEERTRRAAGRDERVADAIELGFVEIELLPRAEQIRRALRRVTAGREREAEIQFALRVVLPETERGRERANGARVIAARFGVLADLRVEPAVGGAELERAIDRRLRVGRAGREERGREDRERARVLRLLLEDQSARRDRAIVFRVVVEKAREIEAQHLVFRDVDDRLIEIRGGLVDAAELREAERTLDARAGVARTEHERAIERGECVLVASALRQDARVDPVVIRDVRRPPARYLVQDLRAIELAAIEREHREAAVRARVRRIEPKRFLERAVRVLVFSERHLADGDRGPRARVGLVALSRALIRRERFGPSGFSRERVASESMRPRVVGPERDDLAHDLVHAQARVGRGRLSRGLDGALKPVEMRHFVVAAQRDGLLDEPVALFQLLRVVGQPRLVDERHVTALDRADRVELRDARHVVLGHGDERAVVRQVAKTREILVRRLADLVRHRVLHLEHVAHVVVADGARDVTARRVVLLHDDGDLRLDELSQERELGLDASRVEARLLEVRAHLVDGRAAVGLFDFLRDLELRRRDAEVAQVELARRGAAVAPQLRDGRERHQAEPAALRDVLSRQEPRGALREIDPTRLLVHRGELVERRLRVREEPGAIERARFFVAIAEAEVARGVAAKTFVDDLRRFRPAVRCQEEARANAARGRLTRSEDTERAELRVGLVELTEEHRDVCGADARLSLRRRARSRRCAITRERARAIVERELHVALGARDGAEQRGLRARALDGPRELGFGELARALHREETRGLDVRFGGERRIARAHRPARAAQRAVERLVEER